MLPMMLALTATATATPIHITPSIRSQVMLRADLDEDGVVEQVVVGFSLQREIHIAVYEPDGQVSRLSLGQVVDFSGVRDELFVSLTEPEETGVPLLLVAGGALRWVTSNFGPGGLTAVRRAVALLAAAAIACSAAASAAQFSPCARLYWSIFAPIFAPTLESQPCRTSAPLGSDITPLPPTSTTRRVPAAAAASSTPPTSAVCLA